MIKINSAKKFAILSIFIVFPLLIGLIFPFKNSKAQTSSSSSGTAPDSGVPIPPDTPSDIDLEQCAYDLTEYMNTALDEVGNPQWAILTSPAFNLTSQFEWPLFQMMQAYGAKFDQLDYMSGNAYTRYNDDGSVLFTAYEWYDGTAGYNWKGSFSKPMLFTEYGDFATSDLGLSYYAPEHITSMREQFNIAAGSGDKVVYFAALPGNPEFAFHNIAEDDLASIIGGGGGVAGINSAQQLNAAGDFARTVNGLGYSYVLEIITGPSSTEVANYINSIPPGMVPVIRSCWGDTCGMLDPLVLAQFIKDVDSQVSRPWHVLVGPNEPLSDPWVSPACGSAEREWEWEYIRCENVAEPEDGESPVEFHSLRPYPGSPCPDDDYQGQKVLMCGQSVIVEENFEYTLDQVDTSQCTTSTTTQNIDYTDVYGDPQTSTVTLTSYQCDDILLQSSSEITLDFSNSELPILGNTEDVPNGASSADGLSYEQRVNNYVSWYLQGAIPTAEEPFQSPTDPEGERNIVSFSGPIQKLMPWDVMNKNFGNQRYSFTYDGSIIPTERRITSIRSEKSRLLERVRSFYVGGNIFNWTSSGTVLELLRGDQRHNQIVACGGGFPEACYSQEDQSRARVSDLSNRSDDLRYPYIPLSSTEDALAAVRATESSYGQPTAGNDINEWIPFDDGRPSPYYEPYAPGETISKNFDELYLAHARESDQLAKLLQSTYIPAGFESNSSSGMPPLEELEILPFCTIENTVATPGDNLYGDKTREDIACNDLDGNPYPDADPDNCDDTRGEQARNIATRIEYQGLVSCEFTQTINSTGYSNCLSPNTVSSCRSAADCASLGGTEDPSRNPQCGTEVWCTYRDPDTAGNTGSCFSDNISQPTCSISARTAFDLETESPYFEDIFNRLVYGNMAFFRKIYPRLAANNKNLEEELQAVVVPGPEGLMENIPGETTVGAGSTNLGSNANYVGSTTIAGDPEQNNPGSSGKLYFPYLGTIHQHFLTDVQCALRPGGLGCDNISIVDEDLDSDEVDVNCDVNAPAPNLGRWAGRIISKSQVDQWADSGVQPFNDLVSIENISACYNDLVGRAIRAGYDPAFVMAIWAEESWASNYEALDEVGLYPVADMGCTVGYSRNNYNHQLTCIENLLGAWTRPSHWSFDESQGMQCRDADSCTSYREWLILFAEGRQGCRDLNYDDNPAFLSRIAEYYQITSGGRSLSFNETMLCN